jgi:FAD:protein FMN transferase
MKPAFASARRARPLLGTFVEIEAGGAARSRLDTALDDAFEAVAEVHRLMSPFERDGDVNRLNRQASARPVTVHPWTYEVLGVAVELFSASSGLFDIAVTPGSRLKQLRPQPDIELLPARRVRFLSSELRIDLGGIAKGFAVDRAVDRLRASAVPYGVVNAGGDVAAFGEEPAPVAIRHPRRPLSILCRVELTNEALASSGGRLDFMESADATASAILDPRTGAPASAVLGATVRAPLGMVADALTKVVMLTGESMTHLLSRYGASALFMAADGELHITRDWSGSVHVAA